ncbi:MAG: hypothetical protein H6Q73_4130 [Firmicutes bacterium]|nr:hypothetical protein [Bacillota bacterium]
MNTKRLFIVGAGSYGEAMLDLAQNCGYSVEGFYDDDEMKKGTTLFEKPVIGTTEDLFKSNDSLGGTCFAVAIGNNPTRRSILEKIRACGGQTPSLIHPSAEISVYAKIGEGVYIQPKAVIWTKVTIEDDCVISPGNVIAHHSTLRPGSFVSTLSSVGSNVTVERDVFIGMGCTIMTGVNYIGANSTIGAGAVVIRNVLPDSVVAGVPAKVIKMKKQIENAG